MQIGLGYTSSNEDIFLVGPNTLTPILLRRRQRDLKDGRAEGNVIQEEEIGDVGSCQGRQAATRSQKTTDGPFPRALEQVRSC